MNNLKTPISATQFFVGSYRCRYGQALDQFDKPTGEYCVWCWNAYYWQLLFRNASYDYENAARWHLQDGLR